MTHRSEGMSAADTAAGGGDQFYPRGILFSHSLEHFLHALFSHYELISFICKTLKILSNQKNISYEFVSLSVIITNT